jgi:hypothetical protein
MKAIKDLFGMPHTDIRAMVLKQHNYCCQECKATNNSKGYFSESGLWNPCDAFMIKWAQNNGHTIVTIHLNVLLAPEFFKTHNSTDVKLLCRRHAAVWKNTNRVKISSPDAGKL